MWVQEDPVILKFQGKQKLSEKAGFEITKQLLIILSNGTVNYLQSMESVLVQTKLGQDELLYFLSHSKAALIIYSGSGNQVIVKGKVALALAWAIAFARSATFRSVSFLEYLLFFRAVFAQNNSK